MKRPNDVRASTSSAPAIDSPSCSLPRILVGDDDRHMRQLDSEVMPRCGFRVDAAEYGAITPGHSVRTARRPAGDGPQHPQTDGRRVAQEAPRRRHRAACGLGHGQLAEDGTRVVLEDQARGDTAKPHTIAQSVSSRETVTGRKKPR